MRNFILGIAVTLGAILVGGLVVAGFGLIDTSAQLEPSKLETYVASKALDAAVKRRSGGMTNPVTPTDANLLEGMTLYAMNCAGCHGTLDKSKSILGSDFYPPAPQLIIDPPDDPEWHTFHLIKYGVRWTGMPAWSRHMKDDSIWKVAAFLSRVENLPPAVQEKMPKPAAGPGR